MASFDLEADRSALAYGAWLRAASVSCADKLFSGKILSEVEWGSAVSRPSIESGQCDLRRALLTSAGRPGAAFTRLEPFRSAKPHDSRTQR